MKIIILLMLAQSLGDVAAQEAARRSTAPKAERVYAADGRPNVAPPPAASVPIPDDECTAVGKQSVITGIWTTASKEHMEKVRRCTKQLEDRAAAIKAKGSDGKQ